MSICVVPYIVAYVYEYSVLTISITRYRQLVVRSPTSTVYTKTWVDNVTVECCYLPQVSHKRGSMMNIVIRHHHTKIVPLRDVIVQGRPSKTHLLDTLQALKRLAYKELGNGKPVY